MTSTGLMVLSISTLFRIVFHNEKERHGITILLSKGTIHKYLLLTEFGFRSVSDESSHLL